MKNNILLRLYRLSIIVSLLLFMGMAHSYGQEIKIDLNTSMVTNESGYGDATRMVDEQTLAGDPINGNGGKPSNKWKVGYSTSMFPASAYIDLGSVADLSRIYLFDYNNIQDLIVEYGEPGDWHYLFTEPLDRYKKWKEHFVSCSTQYIRFTQTGAGAYFSEVVIYANSITAPPPSITDFYTDSVSENTAYLSWTDVDFDTLIGNLTGYDLRYSTVEITDVNFYFNAQFPISIIPGVAGTVQTAILPNLCSGSTYYLALKVVGDIPNSNPNLYGGAAISCSELSNVLEFTTLQSQSTGEYRMVLEPLMVVDESGYGDAINMVDEQLMCGNPANSSYEPVTDWTPSISSSYYPLSSYIDLGSVHHLTKLYMFDDNGVADVIVEYGQPGNWNFLFIEELNTYQNWKLHNLDIFARYIRFTISSSQANFNEVVLFAYDDGIPPVESKIYLDPNMLTNLSNEGDATLLVDEQVLAGDPANSAGGNPTMKWSTGFSSSIPYPCYAVIDMGKPIDITKIFLRDVNSSGEFTIDFGSQANWTPLISDGLTGYLTWNQHNVSATARYLRCGRSAPTSNVSEIVVYGYDYYQNVIDSIPPATVTDLIVSDGTTSSLTLNWTAPGDDGFTGQVLFYDMRYSHEPITNENFGQAIQVASSIYPEDGGTSQNIVVDGLNSRTPYYFAFYTYDDFQNKSELSNVAFGETEIEIGGPIQKVFLSADMILNECVQGDATFLTDEQIQAGDPANNEGGFVENLWDMDCSDWFYPGSAMIDLGAMYNISEIYLYDDEDDASDTIPGPVTISFGGPFDWTSSITDSLLNSGSWNNHTVNQQSRYIRITLHNKYSRFSEIVVYGSAMADLGSEPTATIYPTAQMEDLIGVNAFVNDPLGRMAACGSVREYHKWMWVEGNNDPNYPGYPNNENAWYSSSTGWDFDNYYTNMKNMGISCSPAIQDNTVWMIGGDYSKLYNKPISENDDPLAPASYIEHADHLFQYAARYGSNQVATNLLKVDPGIQPISGLDKLNYYENWNEQDKWWKGRGAFFLPYEYAAMSSADCDGHLGTMGATLGLKNADPNAKLVMGGIANPKLDYIRALKLWSDNYRNGDFPWDVINVHHYCNDGGGQYSGDVGISPEADGLKERMQEFVDYRNKYLPGVEVWISEFGYDTHESSDQRAPVIGTFDQEEVQAQWIIRSYLALASAKVDRAQMYMLRDVDVNSSTNYRTSGLTAPMDSLWAPKPSWYYVYTMKNRLKGFYFDTEIASGNANVNVYKFVNQTGTQAVYAVWCPTSNQTTVPNYSLQLVANETQAMLIEMQVNDIDGVETNLTISNSTVSINVSERPVFVIVNDGNGFPVVAGAITKIFLDSTMIVDESGYGGVNAYVDEQSLAGDPFMGMGGEPETTWSTPYNTSAYPYNCYIDLG
ncbi:MAG: hypothetical protein U9R19_03755, partial [Bacteroidota bacterium]|nr:hypothetical protein [Bacteroidota bacterium]